MDLARLHFPTIDSTNAYALRQVDRLCRTSLTVISSDEQTSGRGRGQRKWDSPLGVNAYLSFCCFVPREFPYSHNFAQFLSLICCECLSGLGVPNRLKWPNDVLIDGKKTAGVLCEMTASGSEKFVVNGIGLNVNLPKEALENIPGNPTSLLLETGKNFVVSELSCLLIEHYHKNLEKFLQYGFSPFLEKYRDALAHQEGDGIFFHEGESLEEGKFHSIADNGSLNLIALDGQLKIFFASDKTYP